MAPAMSVFTRVIYQYIFLNLYIIIRYYLFIIINNSLNYSHWNSPMTMEQNFSSNGQFTDEFFRTAPESYIRFARCHNSIVL